MEEIKWITPYQRHIKRRTCPRCGKPVEDGYSYCEECREKNANEQRLRRAWYIEHGICPICGKNNLFGNEKSCIECKAKRANKYKKDPMTAEKARRRRKYAKERGICIRCMKRNATEGFSTCEECRKVMRRKKMIARREQSLTRAERVSEGVCYVCGKNPVIKGKGVCESCRDKLSVNIKKAQQSDKRKTNDYWRKSMGTVFGHYTQITHEE